MLQIKANKIKVVNEKALIAAVDVGKERNTGYCRCPDGEELKAFDFSNNAFGFNMFYDRVCRMKEAKALEEIIVGYESTGSYAEPLIQYLRVKGVQVVQVNPMHTKRVKELVGNSPGKTDQKDPKVIADIIRLGRSLTVVVPEGAAAELRRLIHSRERAIQRRTALFNQLQDLVYLIFPEFLQVMRKINKTARYLLAHYPTPLDMKKIGLKRLHRLMKERSRGAFGEERARALYEAAQFSVGIKEGQESIAFEIREILALIETSNTFIDKLEEKIAFHLERIPYSKYMLTIKGIGVISAGGIIGEVGDFTKFRSSKEIEKLAGLDLYEVSSGKHKGTRRISKRGRPLLRKLLFFAALNVVRSGGALYTTYQQYLERNMRRMKALIAITRKLLRIFFALVRTRKEYVQDYRKTQNAFCKEVA